MPRCCAPRNNDIFVYILTLLRELMDALHTGTDINNVLQSQF
jgi:hypothetical protein